MQRKHKSYTAARFMYVEQMKTGKEIAEQLDISEQTISKWVKQDKWQSARDAKINGHSQRVENIRRVISNLSDQAIEIQELRKVKLKNDHKKDVEWCDKQAVLISDQVSKWSKALEQIDKRNRISLEVYLEVMEQIFKHLQAVNEKLYMQTLDFQERHVQHASQTLG